MKILFDTNVVLDVLQQRKLHFIFSAPSMNRLEQGRVTRNQKDYERSTVAIYSPQELDVVLSR